MENNYESLESQIGALGDDPMPTPKKLKHKASYGMKEDLSDSEKEEMDAFLSRSRRHNEKAKEEIEVRDGWIPVDREEMGVRKDFYPEEWEFFIRPATVQAIKNWTAIDEERPDVVNRVLNEICKSCIKIDTHSQAGASWAQINSWDRFWFVLKVREYTYAQGQSKVEFTDECSQCGEEMDFVLSSKGLFYEFPDEDLVKKYWNGEVWNIDPKEYDVDGDNIILYTPKLGKDEAIIEWATAKVRAGGKIDENFLKFLPWMFSKPLKDVQMMDRQFTQLYKVYKGWSLDMFSFMNDVINNITINQSEKLRMACPHCSQEAISTVQFPDGIKILFEVKTTAKKFGSR